MKIPITSLEHEVRLDLASGAHLKLLYFTDREQRWIFTYNFGPRLYRHVPELINEVRLVADYLEGQLSNEIVLSMHVIIPSRLGTQFFVGLDVSPGARTYLEFNYARRGTAYRLIEIAKGAHTRVRLDDLEPSLMRQFNFPFPIHDYLPCEANLSVPFLRNDGALAHFSLPICTHRQAELTPPPGSHETAELDARDR